MKATHAILGAGGVGGFVGAILAHAGARVILLLRPETYADYPDTLHLASPFGNLTALVIPALQLEEPVDALWVTPKATQLDASLRLILDPALTRMVVPLLNGVDHISLLRARFGLDRVIPATIACEVERTAPGRIVHRSPFARFGFSAAGQSGLTWAANALAGFGCECRFDPDERTLLWRKLVMLAPIALCTTAAGMTAGQLWASPQWAERLEGAAREACAVARASGAAVDVEETLRLLHGMPATMRSSMQKDVAARRPPELDAIAGPILRGGRTHGIPVPVTAALSAAIEGS